jgi:hypothetical protein
MRVICRSATRPPTDHLVVSEDQLQEKVVRALDVSLLPALILIIRRSSQALSTASGTTTMSLEVPYCPYGRLARRPLAAAAGTSESGWPAKECLNKGPGRAPPHTRGAERGPQLAARWLFFLDVRMAPRRATASS